MEEDGDTVTVCSLLHRTKVSQQNWTKQTGTTPGCDVRSVRRHQTHILMSGVKGPEGGERRRKNTAVIKRLLLPVREKSVYMQCGRWGVVGLRAE